jgi:membrane protein YdbS with pleckstrin-like domain
MRALDPRQLTVLRIRAGIAALALLAAAGAIDATLLRRSDVPFGLLAGGAGLAAAALVLLIPRRRYRAWAWRIDEDELRIASGLLFRTDAILPFGRVQHIDIVRGPLERRYGLGSLVLHTAGTRSAAMLLPGLEIGEAETIRDHVRAKIREDLV